MKKLRLVLVGMALVFTMIFILHAQETGTAVQSGAVSEDASSMSDLEVELQALEQTATHSGLAVARHRNLLVCAALAGQPRAVATDAGRIFECSCMAVGRERFCPGRPQCELCGTGGADKASGLMTMDSFFSPLTMMTTNDLWLQLNGVTNDGTGWTANLTINTPWNDTDLTHDLLYTKY